MEHHYPHEQQHYTNNTTSTSMTSGNASPPPPPPPPPSSPRPALTDMTTERSALPKIIQSRPMDLPINAIYVQRNYYAHYPPFQRDQVWPPSMQRELIDSILHGFYIPAILVSPRPAGGGFWIIDGQQRVSTILSFMNDEFRTGEWHDVRDEPGHQMREPRRLFSELSEPMQEQFRSYLLRFIVLDNVEDYLLARMFRRLQHQIPLTTSEKLWSYSSKFTHAAVDLTAHPFFAELYTGRRNRKQTFQMAVYALIVELSGLFVGMEADRLRRYCSGRQDPLITNSTRESLDLCLFLVKHLFAGTSVTVMTELVLLIQAVRLLEAAGFDLYSAEEGCLTEWYKTVQQENQKDRERGFMNLFSQIPKVHFQRQVWQRHLWILSTQPGLLYPAGEKAREGGSTPTPVPTNAAKGRAVERILAWIRTDRHCIQCKHAISLGEINDHIVRPADYVDTALTTTCLASVVEGEGGEKGTSSSSGPRVTAEGQEGIITTALSGSTTYALETGGDHPSRSRGGRTATEEAVKEEGEGQAPAPFPFPWSRRQESPVS